MARGSHGRGISVIVVFWNTTALQGRIRQNVFPEAIHPHAVIFPELSLRRCLTLLHPVDTFHTHCMPEVVSWHPPRRHLIHRS